MTVVINGTTGISTPGLSNSSTTTNTGNVTNSGTVTNASTISVGNATPSSSGAGITFPATQSASTDANTLDDYEEGTWTPVFNGSSSNPTITSNVSSGSYIKIGKQVSLMFYLSGTRSGGSGDLFITGLPFAFNSINETAGPCLTYQCSFGGNHLIWRGYNSTSTLGVLGGGDSGSGWAFQPVTGLTSSGTFAICGQITFTTA